MKYYLQTKPVQVLLNQGIPPTFNEEVELLQHTFVSVEQARNMSLVASHLTGEVQWVRTDFLLAKAPLPVIAKK